MINGLPQAGRDSLGATLLRCLTGPLAETGAPLLLGVALAIGYDLTLWRSYRATPLGEAAR